MNYTCLSIDCPERTGGECNVKERMNKTNVEEWVLKLKAIIGDLEVADDFIPSREQVTFDVLHKFLSEQIALAEQRGAERVINAIPYELPLPSPQGLSSITLAPLKQSLKDKFLTNTNT